MNKQKRNASGGKPEARVRVEMPDNLHPNDTPIEEKSQVSKFYPGARVVPLGADGVFMTEPQPIVEILGQHNGTTGYRLEDGRVLDESHLISERQYLEAMSPPIDYREVLYGHFERIRDCLIAGDETTAAVYSEQWKRVWLTRFTPEARSEVFEQYRTIIEGDTPEDLRWSIYGLLGITPKVGDPVQNLAKMFNVKIEAESKSTPQGDGWTKYLADKICEIDRFATSLGGELYRFSETGVYRPAGRYIAQAAKRLLEAEGESARWSKHRVSEIVEYISVDAPIMWAQPPKNIVNVLNGLLDVETGELHPHTWDHLSPIQLPMEYNPNADCPAWHKFGETTLEADCRHLLFEIPAWLMTPDTSIQKALLALGEGSNGKSVYLNALKNFLGPENVASLSLQKLENNRFATSRLLGKLANVVPDLPSEHLTSTSVFKSLTGGDLIHAERKYGSSFEFESFARLVFSANHPPRSSDSSKAFFRRWLVVTFDNTFSGDNEIPRATLDAQLADPTELAGVLNYALIALHRIRAYGIQESKSMKDAWRDFRETTDPVEVWLQRNTIQGGDLYVSKAELCAEYNHYAEQNGRPFITKKSFGSAIKQWKPNIEDGQRTIRQDTKWCWLGIGLKKNTDLEDD